MQSDPQQDLIYALTVSPGNGPVYAARADGLFLSADGGHSWRYAYQSFLQDQPLPTLAVALSPAFERDQTVIAGAPGAILRSQDGGDTWAVIRLEEPAPLVSGIAFSPNFEQDGTVFAISGDDGVFCSYDYGGSWTNWNFGLLDANGLCIAVSPGYAQDRTVFAGTSTGLFRSTNGGKSWQGLDLPVEDQPVLSLALSPDYAQDRTLWIGTDGMGLYRSMDGGTTWVLTGEDLLGHSIDALLLGPNFCASQKMAALVEHSLLLSTDAGVTFQPWPVKAGAEEITAISAVPGLQNGARLVAARADLRMIDLDF